MKENLKQAHFRILVDILMSIVECEGGYVETLMDGSCHHVASLVTTIPQSNWCEGCCSLYSRFEEQRIRWTRSES